MKGLFLSLVGLFCIYYRPISHSCIKLEFQSLFFRWFSCMDLSQSYGCGFTIVPWLCIALYVLGDQLLYHRCIHVVNVLVSRPYTWYV